jgi:hypothetical protein
MNLSLIQDALLLPTFWCFVFAFVTSVGYTFVSFKRQRGVLYNNLFTWFWYGVGVTIAFLQIWNLFLPIGIYTWFCLLPFAVWGFINLLRSGLLPTISRPHWIVWLLGLFILIFLVVSSLDNSFIYDTLVYHFYTIKWFSNYPATPGTGNLFIYLGLNQSYFLFPAFLDGVWGSYKGACAASGLFAVVICSEIILTNAKRVIDRKFTFLSAFQLLFLPLCINIGVQNLSSPTPDTFVNLLTFKVFSDLITCLEAKKIGFQDIFLLLFYCVLGVVMKMSFAGVAMGIGFVVLVLLSVNNLWKLKTIAGTAAILLLLLIPWVLRGIISTGYIGFPAYSLPLPVDWRVPKAELVEFYAYIKGFARTLLHGKAATDAAYNYKWLPAWIKRMLTSITFVVPVVLCLGVCGIMVLKKIRIRYLSLIFACIFISLIFWFFTAPDVRFARFTLWTFGLAPLAYFIAQLKPKCHDIFGIVIVCCCLLIMARNWNDDPEPLGNLPSQQRAVFTTKSGLKINVIKGTPPGDDWQLNDCPIPCSVYPDSNLMLRKKTIRDGFRNSAGDKDQHP